MGEIAVQKNFRRFEEKYLLTEEKFALLDQQLREYLIPDQFGRHTICNIYFDTDSFDMISWSLDKPMYKEKFRIRSYGVPSDEDQVFAEIKKKFEKIVYKRRIAATWQEVQDLIQNGRHTHADLSAKGMRQLEQQNKRNEQIENEIIWFMKRHQVRPKAFIGYDREAYTVRGEPELRLTLDRNLRYRTTDLDLRKGDQGDLIMPENPIVMEIKYPGTAPVWLSKMLSQLEIFPITFSKYGTCYKRHLLDEDHQNISRDSYYAVYGKHR